jgi:hypothetical protein
MTTYTAIADSEIDPESPGIASLFTRLRDNPLAIAEGDATAPSISYSALTAFTVAGGTTYYLTQKASESVSGTGTPTKVIEWQISLSGTVNTYFGLRSSSAPYTAEGQIYVNGSAVGTLRSTTSTTAVYYSEDITVSEGDLVQIYLRTTAGLGSAYADNSALRDSNIIPGSIVRTV